MDRTQKMTRVSPPLVTIKKRARLPPKPPKWRKIEHVYVTWVDKRPLRIRLKEKLLRLLKKMT